MNFNHQAAKENKTNLQHTRIHNANGNTVLSIDTKQATYRGVKVQDLNSKGRKQFEDMTVLLHVGKAGHKGLPKVHYR